MFVEILFTYEKKQKNIKIARITCFILNVTITHVIVWKYDRKYRPSV